MVQASIFGKNDGPGASLVYYLGLPEGWTPDQEPNKVLSRDVAPATSSSRIIQTETYQGPHVFHSYGCMLLQHSVL